MLVLWTWTPLAGDMNPAQEGVEYGIEDPLTWAEVQIEPCTILEVPLAATDLDILTEMWAAFLVKRVEPEMDGSYTLEVDFLGCEEDEGKLAVAERLGRADSLLHLCVSRPCVEMGLPGEPRNRLHVTQFRSWSVANFAADYVSAAAMKGVAQAVKAIEKRSKANTRLRKPKEKAAPKAPAGKTPRGVRSKPKAAEKDKDKREDKPGVEISEEQRNELRRRLGVLRKQHHGEPPEPGGVEKVRGDSEEDGRDGEETESMPYEPSEPLDTGTRLKERNLDQGSKNRRGREDKIVPYKDTNAEGTRTLRNQLVERALACSRARKEAKKKKRTKSKGEGAIEALRKILTSGDKSTKKNKKDKTKKKRRRRLESGVIVSSSNSCSSTSEEAEEDASTEESDLEAPMKKRSRSHPGSVLASLTEHIRTQMDQDAMTDLPKDGRRVTTGVKVVSYFNQHIKVAFPNQQREMREMFTLGAALDLLRLGDLPRLGDALAARFIAIHQSLLDQSWSMARHMELYPLEDSAAAAPNLVLATRKHTRLVERVQGKGTTWQTWGGKGRPRAKGDWWDNSEQGGKGKKGKGDRKGKGKAKGWTQGPADKGQNEWSKTQDKGDTSK